MNVGGGERRTVEVQGCTLGGNIFFSFGLRALYHLSCFIQIFQVLTDWFYKQKDSTINLCCQISCLSNLNKFYISQHIFLNPQ